MTDLPPNKISKVFLCSTYIECTRNLYETTRLSNYFKENGIPVVRSVDAADTIVIITCGFDEIKEKNALAVIKASVKAHAGKTIIVCGCLPSIHGRVQQMFPRAIVLHSITDDGIDRLIAAKAPIRDVQANYLNRMPIPPTTTTTAPLKTKGFFHIQIGEGCLNNCSYCVYKKIRKGVWSKPLEKVVEEFRKGIEQGAQRVVFLAEDCASYGVDIRSSLPELLRACYPFRKGQVKISLTFMEPARLLKVYPDFDREILKKFISDICVPLQSCSGAILKAMHRRYDIKQVLKVIAAIRKINPHIRLITHIIYGFPGETRKELSSSFELIRYFDEIRYFCYMDRPGSHSSTMENKITTREMLWRTNVIQKKQNELIRLGRRCPVVLAYSNYELCQILGIKKSRLS